MIELASVARQYGGIYSTHIRDEGEGVFRAIDEAIHVGKGAKIPVDIIHMKGPGRSVDRRIGAIISIRTASPSP